MSRRARWTLVIGLTLVVLWVLARIFVANLPFVSYWPADLFSSKKETVMDNRILEFALNDVGDEVVKRADFPIRRSKVSTALLYSARDVTFRLAHPQRRLELPAARSVLFYDTVDDPGIGQIDISIQLPMGPNPEGDPDSPAVEAYDREMYALVTGLVSKIRATGWERLISPSEPRLVGVATYPISEVHAGQPTAYSIELGPIYSADPAHALSWEEWRHLADSVHWEWVADGMLLEMSYKRDFRDSEVQLMDGLKITISTEASVTGASHPNAETKAKYAASLPESLAERAEREAKARAAGLEIDESYKDPPIAGIPVAADNK